SSRGPRMAGMILLAISASLLLGCTPPAPTPANGAIFPNLGPNIQEFLQSPWVWVALIFGVPLVLTKLLHVNLTFLIPWVTKLATFLFTPTATPTLTAVLDPETTKAVLAAHNPPKP